METTITRTQSVINRSAVKAYALKVSKERRAGKFTRVGEDFLDQIEAEVEAVIRQTAGGPSSDVVIPDPDHDVLITGTALQHFKEKLAFRALVIVQSKVMRHPSIGCTLKT